MAAEESLLGGASGMIVVEGLEAAVPDIAGLPVRTLTLRDNLVPGLEEMHDTRGPSWDLSVNFVPVPYPDYPPVRVVLPPSSIELWRVVNACADSLLHLQLQYDGVPQDLRLVAMDGAPGINTALQSILLPNGARAEFVVRGPDLSVRTARLVTLPIDAGPAGDRNPLRPLLSLIPTHGAAPPALRMPGPAPAAPPGASVSTMEALTIAELLAATPAVTRRLYFSEVISDPRDPESPTDFYITVDGAAPTIYSMQDGPAIVTSQGTVEDWVVENRAEEIHVFHIHQVHFLAIEADGVPVPARDLRLQDVIQLAYWNLSRPVPSVKLRMDFTAITVGTFLYHCHILGHEDGGMMAKIQVLPPAAVVQLPRPVVPAPPAPPPSSGWPLGGGGAAASPALASASGIDPWMFAAAVGVAAATATAACVCVRYARTVV